MRAMRRALPVRVRAGPRTIPAGVASVRRSRGQPLLQPCAREAELAVDRRHRELEHFGDLLALQAEEVIELDDFALAAVDGAQCFECFLERDRVAVLVA